MSKRSATKTTKISTKPINPKKEFTVKTDAKNDDKLS